MFLFINVGIELDLLLFELGGTSFESLLLFVGDKRVETTERFPAHKCRGACLEDHYFYADLAKIRTKKPRLVCESRL